MSEKQKYYGFDQLECKMIELGEFENRRQAFLAAPHDRVRPIENDKGWATLIAEGIVIRNDRADSPTYGDGYQITHTDEGYLVQNIGKRENWNIPAR